MVRRFIKLVTHKIYIEINSRICMKSLWVLIVFMLALPFVSGELLFTQPKAVYNFGDLLDVTLTLNSLIETTDFAVVELKCGSSSEVIYRSLITVSGGVSREIPLTPRLDSSLFSLLNGSCELDASFGGDNATSQAFVLTRSIITEANVPASLVNPGDSLSVTGTARKANGELLDGFVRLSLEGANLSLVNTVNDGSFAFNLTLPSTLRSGEHVLSITSYEENNEGIIINEGQETSPIIVRVVLRAVAIVLDQPDATLGTLFAYTFQAYDQAGIAIERDVRYDIYAPNLDKSFMTRLTKTGVKETLPIDSSFIPGYWKLEATVGDATARKLFYVNEKELVSFNMEQNNTLVVVNLGNIPYMRSVEIKIGNSSVIKDIDLDVGESKRFKLKAPEASYDIEVNDGASTFSALSIPLTGRAIDVGEMRGSIFNFWWAGLFIIGALCLMFITNVYIARRRARSGETGKKSFGSLSSARTSQSALPSRAYSSGNKEQAAVIAVRTDMHNAHSEQLMRDALQTAHKSGASVSKDATHHLITFSPSFTRKIENELLAVRVAKEIETALKSRGQGGDFKFGIGVGKGEIIADTNQHGRVTSIGTLIPATKRLANASQNEIIISDELHAALRSSLKTEKVHGTNGWRVNEVINRENHRSFIDGFLKRYNK